MKLPNSMGCRWWTQQLACRKFNAPSYNLLLHTILACPHLCHTCPHQCQTSVTYADSHGEQLANIVEEKSEHDNLIMCRHPSLSNKQYAKSKEQPSPTSCTQTALNKLIHICRNKSRTNVQRSEQAEALCSTKRLLTSVNRKSRQKSCLAHICRRVGIQSPKNLLVKTETCRMAIFHQD